jgi:mono/diheme cytochrome c family protein
MRLRFARPAVRRLGLALLTASFAMAAAADDNSVAPSSGRGYAGGAEIYGRICQGCHMPGAQGAAGAGHYPKLAGDPALVSWQYVALTVLHGKNGMPAFGQRPTGEALDFLLVPLSDAQVADVVNYVRSNFGNHYKGSITAEQVAALPHPGTVAATHVPAIAPALAPVDRK